MSRIGKIPVKIQEGVTVTINQGQISVTGSKGTMIYSVPSGISIVEEDGKIIVRNENASKALYGLTRATIANLIHGVHQGFEKKLELSGVGYRAQLSGADLLLSVGFSHPVKVKASDGITFSVNENEITVWGTDPEKVGTKAAEIRKIRPPEPYKGKGIVYKGERIRRKAGKSAKAVGGK